MRIPIAAASAALLSVACATPAPKPAAAQPPAAEKPPVLVTSTGVAGQASATRTEVKFATVKSVDVAGRTLTLVWQSGATGTIRIGPEMQRYDEVFVGDRVKVTTQQTLLLELQPAGSPVVPFTMSDEAARAKPDSAAAGSGAAAGGVQATVTVKDVDLSTRTVTFQDPAGATYAVRAGPGLKIEKLKAGDLLLATYLEAVAVDLQKP